MRFIFQATDKLVAPFVPSVHNPFGQITNRTVQADLQLLRLRDCVKIPNLTTSSHTRVCFSASRASHLCKLQSASAVGVTQNVTEGVTHFCASHLFSLGKRALLRSIPAVCPCGRSVWRLDGPCAEYSLFPPARQGLRRPFCR